MNAKALTTLVAVACLGWALTAQAADNEGRWTRPPIDTKLTGEELYKRDPCLDPKSKEPLTEKGRAWIDGRSAENPNGECHATYVWTPKEGRADGLRIGIIGTHGDSSTGKNSTGGLMAFIAVNRPGVWVVESLRPGICYGQSNRCTSGEIGGIITSGSVSVGSRTTSVVASFRNVIRNLKEIYRLDVVLVYGESGGVNIMSNAATQGNADGLFARGTPCDDDQWNQTSDTAGGISRRGAYVDNVDQLDAIPHWAPGFAVVNMNGKLDNNTKPMMAQMCHEEAVKRGINSRLYTPDWLDHGGSYHLLKEDPEKFKASRKELNEAMDWLIDEAVKFKQQGRH